MGSKAFDRYKNGIISLLNRPWMMYVWLLLITLLAAVLRFFKLGEWSFWIDEIYTINNAVRHFSTPDLIIRHIPPAENWFPTSVILTAQVINWLGINEQSARLVAAVVGVITIPILFFPIRKVFGVRVALIALLLLAVSPWHIDWSQNARGYTTLLLFYTLALFAFYFALEEDRGWYFLLFYVFLYLATSERQIALFLLPVVGIYLLLLFIPSIEKPRGLRVKNLIFLLLPVLLFGAYEILSFFLTGGSMVSSTLSELYTTFAGRPIENPIVQTVFLVYKIGIPLFVVSLAGAVYFALQKNRRTLLMILGSLIPIVIVVALTPFMFVEERYAFASLPSWLIIAALVAETVLAKSKKTEIILALSLIVVLLSDAFGANLMYFHSNHGNRWDWRQAFTIVRENMRPGDMVVSTFSEMGNYYLKQDDVLLWDDMNSESIQRGNQRVWFVVIPDMAWYTGTQDLLYWVERNTRMVNSIYSRTVDNTNLQVYLYDPVLKPDFQTFK